MRVKSVFLALSLVLLPVVAHSDVPPEQQAEIAHLLDYLASSDCVMIRNGKSHDAEEAVGHVQRKYDYYRNKINSTEDFIELAATKSMISGMRYKVKCPGENAVPSDEWLRAELQRFRNISR